MVQSFEEIKANNDARKAYAQQFEQKNVKTSRRHLVVNIR